MRVFLQMMSLQDDNSLHRLLESFKVQDVTNESGNKRKTFSDCIWSEKVMETFENLVYTFSNKIIHDTKLSMEQEKFLTKKVSPKLFSC